MLQARYLRWSTTFGDAGETVLRTSLKLADGHGYLAMREDPPFGEVRRIGNTTVRGPLDSGAWLTTRDREAGLARPVHALLIENKNVRTTLYPRHHQVHQLLHKAALVQRDNPD